MLGLVRYSGFLGLIFLLPVAAFAGERAAAASDSYDVVLHSQSLADQREALTAILESPEKYVQRIQESLREYPRWLRTDPTAAKRAAYISALVRDPSFPPILVKSLGAPEVLDDCEYACPVLFALTIQACFGGWKLPADLDSELTTVHDLKAAIDYMPRISLKAGRIEDVVQGPELEKHREEIEGKTEDQLIQLAGPMTSSLDTRMFAAFRLETLVFTSKSRIDLYLLALNDFEDGSGEYKGAIYQSIYRAELANVQSRSASKTIDGDIYVRILDNAREDVRDGKTNPIERRVVMPVLAYVLQAWSSAAVSANRISATCLCEENFRWPRTNSVDTKSPGLRNPSRELRGSQRTARSPQSQSSHGRVSGYERTGPLFPRPEAESFGAHLPRRGD